MFRHDGALYRQVNQAGRADYDALMQTGLYKSLTEAGQLVRHEEVPATDAAWQASGRPDLAYKLLRPEPLKFISYPYEWSFPQLRDAALLTLAVQEKAVAKGLTLRDASAYNVQFIGGKAPVFIDTLSFEPRQPGAPWVAYRQFCQHFLAPLVLMSYVDQGLQRLLAVHLDGVPLPTASRILGRRAWGRLGIAMHLRMHGRLIARQERGDAPPDEKVERAKGPHPAGGSGGARGGNGSGAPSGNGSPAHDRRMAGLLDSLAQTIRSLPEPAGATKWSDYYKQHSYSETSLERKAQLVQDWVAEARPAVVWDLGSNVGRFSRLAAPGCAPGGLVASFDFDPRAVAQNYHHAKADKDARVLPLLMDLTNPSPGLGWMHAERAGLLERGPCDMALALALVHHLAIGNNVPLPGVADMFARAARKLVIEFVPKSDPQVRRMLQVREDIFDGYTEAGFEAAFTRHFRIARKEALPESGRVLYLMERLA